MSSYQYHLVSAGWLFLLLFLTLFWYFTLHKLSEVLKERLKSTRSHHAFSGMAGMFRFLIRGEFRDTGDQRLITICTRLRQLLYGYLGGIGAYAVFLAVVHPRY